MPELTLLTLNAFGVPTAGARGRLRHLGAVLCRQRPDIVCLQEVQWRPFLGVLRRALAPALPHAAWEPWLHAPKGGLLTLSRHPLPRHRFELYQERGWQHGLALADWFLHKGALVTSCHVGGQPVIVVNTHLIANYDGRWVPGNRYAEVGRAELRQLAALVRALPAEAIVVVAGDFNVPRDSWLTEEFTGATGLWDPLSGDATPTYRPLAGLPDRYAAAIDHTYVRAPAGLALTAEAQPRLSRPVWR